MYTYAGISQDEQFLIQVIKVNVLDSHETISSNATSMSFRSLCIVQMDCKERLKRSDVVPNFVLQRELQHSELLSSVNHLESQFHAQFHFSKFSFCLTHSSVGIECRLQDGRPRFDFWQL